MTNHALFDSKSATKGDDKESVLKEAVSNAKLWEVRFGAAAKSRHEYRENARKLITQNEVLQNAVDQVSLKRFK